MVDAIVDDDVLEIEGTQSVEASDIDTELIEIRSPLMVGIDAAFRTKEMFCRTCIEHVDRQRFRARTWAASFGTISGLFSLAGGP
jgi:hypothetical protein